MSFQKWGHRVSRGMISWVLLAIMSLEMPAVSQTGGAAASSTLHTIAGVVLDDRNSKPIEGAVVVIEILGGVPVDAQGVQTGQDGAFKISAPSGSQYRILAQKPGFMSFSRMVAESGPSGIPPVSDLGQLRLVAQCAISGKIMDSEGRPLTGASVQVSRVSLEGLTTTLTSVAMTTTNDLGEYRVFGMEPGTYYVSALFQDLADLLGLRQKVVGERPADLVTEDHAVTYYPGSPNVETASPVRLKAGMALSNLDIMVTTAQSYSVRGIVTDLPPNSPPFMVRLQPVNSGGLGVSRGYTLSPGNSAFLFKSIPPGEYVVRAELKVEGRSLSARREVVVSGSPVDDVVLDLRAPFPIVGKISMNGAVNLPENVQISLNAVDRQFRVPIRPQSGGRFQIESVGPDRYSISASDESGAIYVKSVAVDTEAVAITGINIPDSNHVLRIEVSDKAARIEGAALDSEQHPIAGGLAILLGPDTRDFRSQAVVIGSDGKFSFKSLAPGKYRISCFSDLKSSTDATWDIQKKVKDEGREISIAEGDNQQFTLKAAEAAPQ